MRLLLPLIAFALLSPQMAQADDAALLRCRAIAEPERRLICYDAIPTQASATPQAAQAPQAPPTANTGSAADSFGLPARTPSNEPARVESRVPSDFRGWGPNSRIRLDNGQIWRVVDNSSMFVKPAARAASVRRGLLGVFYLDLEGINRSPKVERIE
jgi:hypothetical protein